MKYSILNLEGTVVESKSIHKHLPLLDKDTDFALDRLFVLKEQLVKQKSVEHVLIHMRSSFTAYPGQLEEISAILQDLKDSGKILHFYAKAYDLKELYIASICQNRYLPEDGTISYLGRSFEMTFYKNLLDKLNIEAEVYRRGKYKGAGDIFRVEQIDDAQKEAYGLILKRIRETLEKKVSQNFNAGESLLKELRGGVFLDAEAAQDKAVITDILYVDDLISSWEKAKYKKHQQRFKKMRCGKGPTVAVLSFDGNIVDGKNKKNGLMGKSCGDESYIKEIHKLRTNKKIKALIFKVNSRGGSASASAEIANALLRFKEEKPLLLVQTGVAASGGYYLSFPGERIFTQHSTITGSIGVISLNFYTKEFWEKYGVTHSTLKDGELSDLMSSWRHRTDAEKELIMQHIDHIYQTFIQKVAKYRNLQLSAVDALGQGRIWSGFDALEHGLCDEIGGLSAAIAYLREKRSFKTVKLDFYPKPKESILNKFFRADKHDSVEVLKSISAVSDVKHINSKSLCFSEDLFFFDFRL